MLKLIQVAIFYVPFSLLSQDTTFSLFSLEAVNKSHPKVNLRKKYRIDSCTYHSRGISHWAEKSVDYQLKKQILLRNEYDSSNNLVATYQGTLFPASIINLTGFEIGDSVVDYSDIYPLQIEGNDSFICHSSVNTDFIFKKVGKFKIYHSNGNKRIRGKMKNDMKHGWVRHYDSLGFLQKKLKYKNGKIIRQRVKRGVMKN